MAGIVSATAAQILACRRKVVQLEILLQQFAQGTRSPTALNSTQIAQVDTKVDEVAAALALLNT